MPQTKCNAVLKIASAKQILNHSVTYVFRNRQNTLRFFIRSKHKQPLAQLPAKSLPLSGNSLAQCSFSFYFFTDILSQSEWPTELYLQHPKVSVAYSLEVFHIPSKNQFQMPTNHMVRIFIVTALLLVTNLLY